MIHCSDAPSPGMPANEHARLEALREYAVLDTDPEPIFDSITQIASDVFSVPIALISMVDADRQWFKSCVGVNSDRTRRDESFCAYTILSHEVMVIPDATSDARFARNPHVTGGLRIRFYAGAPLTTRDGLNLGTLCIIDQKPRHDFGIDDEERLRRLAAVVVEALELRNTKVENERKTRDVTLLSDVAVSANSSSTSKEAVQIAIEKVCKAAGWSLGHAYTVTDDGSLSPMDTWWSDDLEAYATFVEATSSTQVTAGEGFLGRVLERRAALAIDPESDTFFTRSAAAQDAGIKTAMAFPIIYDDDVLGVLEFFSQRREVPDAQLLDIMDNIGTQIGIVIRRQRAEADLRLTSEINRLIVEESGDAFISIDSTGVVTQWNSAAERIFGWKRDEAIGRRLHELVAEPLHSSGRSDGLMRLFATGEEPIFHKWVETEATTRDGTELPVELTVWPLQIGDSSMFHAFIRDISDRKQAEEDSRLAREAAERADRAKSEFLSRMSHELRTPLNAILGFGQLLQMSSLDDQDRENVAEIITGGRHLLDLINEVLDIARIETGRLSISVEPVLLRNVVTECISLIRGLAIERNIHVELADDEAVPTYVLADNQRLRQVILNLLSNAVKYNRDAGLVVVRIKVDHPWVLLEVTDTGIGIPPDSIDKVFEPFNRLGAEATHVEGTGLGLALSKHLVEAMGGEISASSTHGQGTTFSVVLQGADEPTAAITLDAVDHDVAEAQSRQEQIVLYIEDNPANMKLVERVMEQRSQVKLLTAMQDELGIHLAREHRPSLILLDVNLPDISGTDVLIALKQDERTAPIPVAVVSADATKTQIRNMEAAGACAYLTKPIDVNELLDVVDTALRQEVHG